MEYWLGFDEKVNEENVAVKELHDIRDVVDIKSLLYLNGAEIDFHKSLEKREFVFNNPNAVKPRG